MCAAVAAAGFKSAACSHALLLLLAVPELCHLSSCLSGLTPPARIRKGGRGRNHITAAAGFTGAIPAPTRCRNCEIKRRDGIHQGRKNGPNANALLVILFEKSAPQCGAGPRAKDSARTNRNTCVEAARNR